MSNEGGFCSVLEVLASYEVFTEQVRGKEGEAQREMKGPSFLTPKALSR